MSILVDANTKVICQGITGKSGTFHTDQCLLYGSQVRRRRPSPAAAARPGPDRSRRSRLPVFNTVAEAVKATGATASMVFVPPAGAADAIMEAADAGITLIVAITEGVPVLDMARAKRFLQTKPGSRLVGPELPGRHHAGAVQDRHHARLHSQALRAGQKGVGVISRSGTLTYEAVFQLTHMGYSQSTCVGIGGDPVIGTNQIELLEMFEKDPRTEAILMIGEIGGNAEEQAAEYVAKHVTKPVAAFIAGQTAPPGRRMGHAGAIISGGAGSAADKIAALKKAGIEVAPTPADLGAAVKKAMAAKK